MSFHDIFQSSFLESITEFSILDTLIALVFATVVGLFIFLIYRKTLTGILYSSGLALTLVGITMVTTLVIMAVTSNVVLSLGMVGALSIVRFRAAIKEPMEIVFLFWALAAGIVIGAGMIPLAIVGSIVIGGLLLVLANRKYNDSPYMLVLRCVGDTAEEAVLSRLAASGCQNQMKAKTVTSNGIELSIEVQLKDPSARFVNDLQTVDGVESVSLVSYNGEYMS